MKAALLHREYIDHDIKQYSILYISLMRCMRFVQVGVLLHMMAVSGILLFFFSGKLALSCLEEDRIVLFLLFGYFSLYGFTLPFFAELDARSRYQNYKLAKDKLFEYGFQARLLKPFMYSRCQRNAVQVAANNLDYRKECKALFRQFDFRWYHLLPRIILKNPARLLSRSYWKLTLFTATHKSKYFLW